MTRPLTLTLLLTLLASFALLAPTALADDDKSKEKPAAEKASEEEEEDDKESADKEDEREERKTTTAEIKPIKVEVTVDGVFVSREMTPVALRPETWSSFKIEEIIPHGSTVREGEVLVKFDAKKLNEEIAELDVSQRLADLALRKAEEELPRLEKMLQMSLTDAEQSHERINDDYKRYQETDRDRYIESLKMNLKSSKQRLDYAKDELTQLEKMYEADDLTEETEELILTRTRQQYEMAEYSYKLAKIRHDESLNIYLPRQDEDKREVVDRADLSLARAKLSSKIDLNRARYELVQQKTNRDKSTERHAKLMQDRGLMELKSPAAGVVYYGRCTSGNWGDMSNMIGKLQPHSTVPTGTVMMTIVDPGKLYLLATVGEKERPTIEPGQPAKVRPLGEGAAAMAASVASVSNVPISSGKFQLEVELGEDAKPDWLVPGMSGKIKVTTYSKKDAVVVNKKAVHSEEDDEDKKYVWLVTGDDDDQTAAKHRVKTGKAKGDLIEIVDGLEEGDVVSLDDEAKKKED
ncbi:MAG: HlyD family efflux transporter periplasmic adaptor subunit [Planctomycetota bacterium]